tara:strand:- start:4113 stop:5219 length:1107 start_codon:yes stop_codon:yes gene_type:complete
MATSYKTFLNNDITSTKTLLHEAVPLTGALVSGTYGTFPNGDNIKNYAHGMFQSVYDYPYLSSSANHIFDITVGFSGISGYESAQSASCTVQRSKKINLYNQMAQTLMGYDQNGNIQPFDRDGDITGGGEKIRDAIFINVARLLGKDEIKKGSFTLKIGTGSYAQANNSRITIQDTNAQNDYRVNSPAGEYGILSCSSGATGTPSCGLIFYQAGVVVLSSSIFQNVTKGGILVNSLSGTFAGSGSVDFNNVSGQGSIEKVLLSSSISGACDNLRHRFYDTSFNNTTELNSTIHFCRANHNDFNYSSNPTYLSSSKIVVKNNTQDAPVSYITTVGLYSADNELLAVAKLSEPLKKDPTNEMTIRVRLDY